MFSVVVPYRPGEPNRDAAWAWVRARWETLCPDAEVILGDEDGAPGVDPARYNHPLAINRGVEQASHDVIVVADADTAFDPEFIHTAVELVGTGLAPWVLPLEYRKIDEASTAHILAADPADPIPEHTSDWIGHNRWSGLVVIPREGFDIAGGYDERFAWWGADDHSFGIAMNALWGPVEWLDGGIAFHLWHPPQEESAHRHREVVAQRDLHRSFIAADGNPDAVRKLIGERP